MENAVAAARAAGPVPNGATAMEEDEPPSKRVRSLYLLWIWLSQMQVLSVQTLWQGCLPAMCWSSDTRLRQCFHWGGILSINSAARSINCCLLSLALTQQGPVV